MLTHVSVKDILLIDAADLELGPGLTVLTGATGAGKSILVEALLLLLGARASAETVRHGEKEGSVQAHFQLEGEDEKRVAWILDEQGLPPLEDGALILRRVISAEGRHKQQVNGAFATVAQLKAVADPLIDFTGQHAHQTLMRPAAHGDLLDAFADNEALLATMGQQFRAAMAIADEMRILREKEQDKTQRLDMARFYLNEIDNVAPAPNEDTELVAEQRRLANATRLLAALNEASALLTEGNDDALSQLNAALRSLSRAADDDAQLKPLVLQLQEAVAIVDDLGRVLAKSPRTEADPERLGAIEDRLDVLKKLMKKHGGDLAHVLAVREQLATEIETLEGASERIDSLDADFQLARQAASATADALTARRKTAARKLGAAIEHELVDLGMPGTRIEVDLAPLTAEGATLRHTSGLAALSARGQERIELRMAANAGDAPKPMHKVASGGELSRVLLAVKRVLLQKDPVPVSVFDEIDSGVGGAVADAIGEKLAAIALGRQVLCISHLAQIAARAKHHITVEKSIETQGGNKRSVSRVRILDRQARIAELSRMLGGKTISDATRKHAEDLFARAHEPVDGKKKRRTAASVQGEGVQ